LVAGHSAYVDLAAVATDGFDDKHDTITAGSDTYFVTSSTVIIDEIDDIDVVKWDDIKEKSVPGSKAYAIFVTNSKNDAKLVVFVEGFSEIAEDEELGVVLDKFIEDGKWRATIKVHKGEEADYRLDKKGDVEIGQVIKFTVKSDGKIAVTPVVTENGSGQAQGFDVTGLVSKKDGNYLTVNSVVYRADSYTLIYDVNDDDVLDDIAKASMTDIKAGKTNVGLIVEGKVIKVIYIVSETTAPSGNFAMTLTDEADGIGYTITVPANKDINDYAIALYDGAGLKKIKAADVSGSFTAAEGAAAGKIYTVKLLKKSDLSVVLEKDILAL